MGRSRTKKRSQVRSRKAGPAGGRRWRRRLWRAALLALGIAAGLLLPWILYLNHLVVTEFEGRKWDLPSRVYARAVDLYAGAPVGRDDLEMELRAAGYRRGDTLSRPGTYRRRGGALEIYRRGFDFPEGVEPARRLEVRLASGAVTRVRDLDSGADVGLARLDPAEIASIYPLHNEDRTLVRIEDVPPLLVTGLQAVEDRQFKQHPGIDLRGIARAALANLRAGRAVQGGSTLTQQLAKNFYLSQERTFSRKVNEAIMALLLEAHYDKGEILEAYLNEVFLGQHGAYAVHGFGRASQFYFEQPLERLEPGQIALLIGLVKGPSYYNPRKHPERALERRNQVLDVFVETGLLSEREAGAARASALEVTAAARARGGRYHAFVELVRRQLSQVYREEDLRSEGLRIFTTLSPSEQEKAQAAVSDGLRQLAERGLPGDLQGALVLADVASGEVRALVGDRDAARVGFNRALHARRQIGSVVKPLVYLLALEHPSDYHLLTRIPDEPLSLRQADGSSWQPENYDGISHGEVTLLEALTQSYNQATVRLGLNIGVNNLLARLQRLGVDAPVDPVPAVFLGAVELTPLEVAQIYQSIAAGGYSVPLRSVLAVQTTEGHELVRYPLRMLPQPRREAIAVLNYALTQVVEQGTASKLPVLLDEAATLAGKTGTTNDRRDSWFVGYTRNRVAVTWVGNDQNRPAGVTGSNAAMRVWADLFRRLPLESVDLRMPDGAFWLWVDREQGSLTAEHCGNAVQLPFVEGSEPQAMTDCLAAARKEDKESFWRKLFGKKN
jgi:penicillin-binding protein 1B